MAFAHVIVLGQRWGCTTDSAGHFAFDRVPVGHVQLKAMAVGFEPTIGEILVPPGEVVHLDLHLWVDRSEIAAARRDSLVRLGRWPPKLNPVLVRRIRSCNAVRVRECRGSWMTGDDVRHLRNGTPREGPLPAVVAEERRVVSQRTWARALASSLRRADFTSPMMGVVIECIHVATDYRVRLSGGEPGVEISLCFACGMIHIHSDDGVQQVALFGETRDALTRLAKQSLRLSGASSLAPGVRTTQHAPATPRG